MAPVLSDETIFLNRLITIIRDNLSDERFGPTELAVKMGMSHSNLHRKVKKDAGRSISRDFRQVRLKRAHDMLKE